MAALGGVPAREGGTFHCQNCNNRVRVNKGPKCPNCGNDSYDERTAETSGRSSGG
jgi:ABC-type ATPase with predicted acetyltransferase domain